MRRLGVMIGFALLQASPASAAAPATVNFTGRLSQGTAPTNGTYNFTFSLWDDPTATGGANQKWTETQTGVQVTSGLFDVALGSVTPLSSQLLEEIGNLYLEITVNTEKLSPRKQLHSVPWARVAQSLQRVTPAVQPADNTHLYLDGYGNTPNGNLVWLRKARGTATAVAATSSSDTLGALKVQGHDGASFIDTGEIAFQARQNFAPGKASSRMQVKVSPWPTGAVMEALRFETANFPPGVVEGSRMANTSYGAMSFYGYAGTAAVPNRKGAAGYIYGIKYYGDIGSTPEPLTGSDSVLKMVANGRGTDGADHTASYIDLMASGDFSASNYAGAINFFVNGGGGGSMMTFASDGILTVPGGTLGTSDERLKKNIRVLDHPLEDLARLRGVRFEWKRDGRASIGVIAQDVEKVYPELVKAGEDGMKGVLYPNLVALLIESTKALKAKNDALEGEVDDLQKRMRKLEMKELAATGGRAGIPWALALAMGASVGFALRRRREK